jgi:DNA transformation protein and related proteins
MSNPLSSNNLSHLKNIGPVTAGWLNAIGIHSRDDLEAVGPVQAYHLLKLRGENVSLNLLYALQGALLDVHWNALSEEMKDELRQAADIAFD